jgi:membrane-associated phospholipid phosphatase
MHHPAARACRGEGARTRSGPDQAGDRVNEIRWPRFLAVALVLVAAAHAADGWAWDALADARVYERDWGRMLRVVGFLPLWALMAAALVLHDAPAHGGARRRGAWRRGALLFAAAAASGIAAELLKLVFRRERPGFADGAYAFRAFTDRPFHNGGLGLPSSHTMVAFGAAAMLARLFPRAAPVWYALAVGCGLSRVLARAHFVSDVVVAALFSWLIVALMWRRWGARPAV